MCIHPSEFDNSDEYEIALIIDTTKKKSMPFDAYEQQALRYNEGKPKWSLVHFKSLEPLVRVLMYGADKYAPDNWKKGMPKKEILNSMQRHLAELIDGEELDLESKQYHVGHIMANCMFYHYYHMQELGEKLIDNLRGETLSSK